MIETKIRDFSTLLPDVAAIIPPIVIPRHRLARYVAPVCGSIAAVTIVVLLYIGLHRIWTSNRGDFRVFYEAARAMRNGTNIYDASTGNYIYPPLVAFLLQPLAAYPQNVAATCWLLISMSLFIVSVVAMLSVIQKRITGKLPSEQWWAAFLLSIVLAVPCLRNELLLGQTDTILIACLAGSLLLLDRFPIVAGALLGVAFNVKYLPVVLLPYLVLRGRWVVMCGVVAGAAIGAFAPAMSTGWAQNQNDWYRATHGMQTMVATTTAESAAVEAETARIYTVRWPRSISFTSGLARLTAPGEVVLTSILIGFAMLLFGGGVWAIYRRGRVPLFAGRDRLAELLPSRSALLILEWCALIVAMLVFSPQTTARHMVLLLPLNVLIAARVIAATTPRDRSLMIAAALCIFLGFSLPGSDLTKRLCVQSLCATAALGLTLVATLGRNTNELPVVPNS